MKFVPLVFMRKPLPIVLFFLLSVITVHAQGSLKFFISSDTVAVRDTTEIFITVENYRDITGASLSFNWDPFQLQYAGLTHLNDSLGLTMSDFGLNDTDEGKISLLYFGFSGTTLPPGDTLFGVKLVATGIIGEYTPVGLSNDPLDIEVVRDGMIIPYMQETGEVVITAGNNFNFYTHACSDDTSDIPSGSITFVVQANIDSLFLTYERTGGGSMDSLPVEGYQMEMLSGLPFGNYVLRVYRAGSPLAQANVFIDSVSRIRAKTTAIDPLCGLDSNGLIRVEQITGGSAPYYIKWSTGDQNTLINTGLPNGTFSYTLRSSTGCLFRDTATLEADTLLLSWNSENEHCFNDSTGILYIEPVSGVPYKEGYIISVGNIFYDTAFSFFYDSFPMGTYNFSVSDSSGCIRFNSVVFAPGLLLSLDTLYTDSVECAGGNTGDVFFRVTSNYSSGYPILITVGDSTFTGITDSLYALGGYSAGGYGLFVSDTTGMCGIQDSFVIEEPDSLMLLLDTIIPASCSPGGDGAITVFGLGGIPPYSFNWSNGDSTAFIEDISSGIITVTVTDSKGCTAEAELFVPTTDGPRIDSFAVDRPDCSYSTDGSVEVFTTPFGSPIVSYTWSSGDPASVINSIGAGIYTVIVTDSLGCEALDSVEVSAPADISISLTSILSDGCSPENTGLLEIVSTGGTGVHQYLWSSGDTTALVDSLGEGIYIVTVTDENNCFALDTFELNEVPPLIIFRDSVFDVVCEGDSTGYIRTGINDPNRPGLTISWNDGSDQLVRSGLPAGVYSLTVTDEFFCSDTDSFVIEEVPQLMISVDSIQDPLCYGENSGYISIKLNDPNRPGLTIEWQDTTGVLERDGLYEGTYHVEVRDDYHCMDQSTIILTGPDSLMVDITIIPDTNMKGAGMLLFDITGATPPYQLIINDSARAGFIVDSLESGTYNWTIMDANGCTWNDTIMVSSIVGMDEISLSEVKVYPNPATDHINIICNTGAELFLYNTSGKLLTNISISPHGTRLDLSTWEGGVYYLKIISDKKYFVSKVVIQN